MEKKNAKEPLSAKVPNELKEIVQLIANEEERSVSQVVTKLLRESPTVKKHLKQSKLVVAA